MKDDLVTITVRRVHLQMVGVLLVGFILGYAAAGRRAAAPTEPQVTQAGTPQPGSDRAPITIDVSGRPATGPARAAVTLVEFTDYQCPFCARYFRETYDSLLRVNGNRLRYVVRNYPVNSLHPDAQKAAEAAECAFDQGKFWEYHRVLFERSPKLARDSLTHFAKRVGLDVSKFERCLDSGAKEAVVRRDLQDGRRYGVIGTPTFFVNGKILVGAQPLTVIQAEIDRAIASR
jgi:protein-disulfide isomerase